MSVTPEEIDAKRRRIADLNTEIKAERARRQVAQEQQQLASQAAALDNEIARLEGALEAEKSQNAAAGLVEVTPPSIDRADTLPVGAGDSQTTVVSTDTPGEVPVAPGDTPTNLASAAPEATVEVPVNVPATEAGKTTRKVN